MKSSVQKEGYKMAAKSRVVAIKGEEINQLPLIIEEGAQGGATNKSVSRVIKPATGALQRARSKKTLQPSNPQQYLLKPKK
jgi:hypothetical protein